MKHGAPSRQLFLDALDDVLEHSNAINGAMGEMYMEGNPTIRLVAGALETMRRLRDTLTIPSETERGKSYHIYKHLKYTDALVDAPRQLLVYAETPGRTIQGAREHLRRCGVKFEHCWPDWAYENGHLTKSGLAELVHRMMESQRFERESES